jgi:site-specific DNA recombinase
MEVPTMDGYIRVSRTMGRHGVGYISPDVQRESLQRWADYHQTEIAMWHVDEDESGGTQDRPGLRLCLDRIQQGATGGIVCWRVDRFARNVGPAEADLQLIADAGAQIAFVDDDIAPSTGATGEYMMTLMLALARMQRKQLQVGWLTARGRAIKRGAFIGGTAPIGYAQIRDKNDPRVGCLNPDPKTAPIIREAYRRGAMDGAEAAQAFLKTEVPDRRWGAYQLRRVLGSRIYLGEVRHGELMNLEAHEPLVSYGVWLAAQVPPLVPRARSLQYPLSGIACCAGCGGSLVGQIAHPLRDGTRPRRYRCGKRWNAHQACPAPASALAEPLEAFLAAELRRGVEGAEWDVAWSPGRLSELQEALEQAEAERLSFATDLEVRQALGPEAFREGCRVRAEAIERHRAAYQAEATTVARHHALAAVDELDDPEQFDRFLRATVARIDVRRGRGPVASRTTISWALDGDEGSGEATA